MISLIYFVLSYRLWKEKQEIKKTNKQDDNFIII